MDRQTLFLLSLGLLIAAGLVVGGSGWALFVRDRRLRIAAAGLTTEHHREGHEEH